MSYARLPIGRSPALLPGGLPQAAARPVDIPIAQWRGMAGSYGLVDRMPLEDPLIGAAVRTLVQGVLDLSLRTQAASSDGIDRECADWALAMLTSLRGGWRAWLASAAQHATRGAVYYEPTYRTDPEGRVRLHALHLLPLRTVDRWEPTPDGWAMVQRMAPSGAGIQRPGGTVTIPPGRMIGLRYMPEADEPEPWGMLRQVYGPFDRRGGTWSLRTDAHQRGAYGIPEVVNDGTGSLEDEAKAREIAMMSRAGEFAAESMPRGWSKKFQAWPVNDSGMESAINGDARLICKALGCPHLLTGDENGTEALIREQVLSIYRPTVRTVAETILEALAPIVESVCSVAYPGRPAPRLIWEPPSDQSILERATETREWLTAGHMTDPDGSIAAWLRDAFDLPPAPEQGEEEAEDDDDTPSGQIEVAGMGEDPEPDEDEPDEKEPAAGSLAASDLIDPMAPPPPPAVAPAPPPVDPSDVLARFADDCLVSGPGGRPVALAERSIRASETVVPLRGLQRRAADALVAWTASIADDFGGAVAEQAERWPDGDAVASAVLPPELEASLRATLSDLYGDAYNAGSAGARAEVRRISRNPAAVQAVVEDVRERPIAALADGGCRCGKPHGAARGFDVLLAADPQQPPPPRSARGGAGTVARLNAADLIERWVSEVARDNMQRIQTASRRVLDALGPGGSLRGVSFDVVRDAVRDAIEALSPGETGTQAVGPVNTMFSLGRMQEQIASGADRWLYSTSIESNRCEPCIDHDLTLVGPEDLDTYSTPASWCLGGDRCNCLLIAVPSAQLPSDLRGAA